MRAGEIVILEPTEGRRRGEKPRGEFLTVELDVPKRLAVNFDVRRLLDRLRLAIGREMRAGANADLAAHYSIGPIIGTAARARTSLRDTSRSADTYFAKRFDTVAQEILARETQAWLVESCPAGESLPAADIRGGPLPR